MLTLCPLALRLCCLLQASSLGSFIYPGFQLSNVETTQECPRSPCRAASCSGIVESAQCVVGESCSAHLGLRVLICRVG